MNSWSFSSIELAPFESLYQVKAIAQISDIWRYLICMQAIAKQRLNEI